MDRVTYDERRSTRPTILETSLRQSADAVRALARPRRRAAALRVHAAVRGQLHARRCCASRPRWPRRPARTGRRTCPRTAARSREVAPALPRGARLPRRLRPGRRRWRRGDPGPRHPPLRARGRAAGGDRRARRALPGLEPVPGERRDAAGALPRRPGSRSGWARTSPPGPELSIFTVMRAGRLPAERAARRAAAETARPPLDAARLAAARHARRRRGRWASTTRSARSRRARRPTSSPSIRARDAPLPEARRRRRPRGRS